jgi:diguanylate cyclase (GGDEF)-like protein/PAS domain S-box-containing protein
MWGPPAASGVDRHLQARFEQSHLPQAITGLDLRLVMVNEAMGSLLGRSVEELIGVYVDTLTHPEAPASPAWELLEEGMSGQLEFERVYQRPDGTPVPARLFATLVRDPGGAPQNIAAFVVDLTDQKRAEEALRSRETLFQALLERASDVAVVNAPDGTVVYANATVSSFGYTPEQVVGQQGLDFVHPEDRHLMKEAFALIQTEPVEAMSLVYRHHHADGTFRWVEAWLCNKIADPQIGGIVTNLRDVTARVESDRALQDSQERYRAIVETAQEGIWVADPQGRTLYANKKMADIVGHSIEAMYARRLSDLIDADDAAMLSRRLLQRRTAGTEEYELHLQHPDGTSRCLKVCSSPLWDAEGEFLGSLGMVSDITELKRVEEALRRQALYDHLTCLPNKTLLQDRLEQATERHARGVTDGVAVVFLDVDQFKLVNDSLGHAVGDRLLSQLAARLRAAALPGETVARFGGDEFVVLTEGVTCAQAHDLSGRMLAVLDEPFDIDGRTVHVTASAGIATSAVCPPEELLQAADAAMYVAKRRGCGEAQMFDVSLAAEARTRFDLNVELRSALCDEKLELWYQPIVEIASGRLLGIEALARWNHPVRGFVSPELFVSIAEHGGFVRNLDRWVLRRAAADLVELRAGDHVAPDVYVSVNVSALHLAQGDLWSAVSEAVWLADLPSSCLCLEVTETAVMADPTTASAVLRRITNDGFRVALDDFGTGYSSLAYLRNLPVSTVKIDRSFVVDAAEGAVDRTICASVVALCRDLGILAIAEGVETQAQYDMLRELGCPAGQGYRWAEPMPKEDLVAWLARGMASAR